MKRLNEAIDKIRAEDSIKISTRDYLDRKRHARIRFVPKFAVAFILLISLVGATFFAYFTPTSAIVIEAEPSIEIKVNRFNQVIGYQMTDEALRKKVDSLEIIHKPYEEALDLLLHLSEINSLDEVDIIVISDNEDKRTHMYKGAQKVAKKLSNTKCHMGDSQAMKEAEKLGLSYGKYRAYERLKTLDPSITIEKIKNLSMREIRERMNRLEKP